MHIRTADLGDAGAIAEIEGTVSSAWSEELIAEELKHRAAEVLVALSDTKSSVVGWCSVRRTPPEAELLKIAVAPEYRNRGVGSRLLDESCNQAAAVGCSSLFLEVRTKNRPARNFYAKHGFCEHGKRKKYYRHPEDDAIIYMKSILDE